jgi:hypothetical protein
VYCIALKTRTDLVSLQNWIHVVCSSLLEFVSSFVNGSLFFNAMFSIVRYQTEDRSNQPGNLLW